MADGEDAPVVKIDEFIAAINNTGNKGASKLQWVSVVGVGTFLIVGIVPWMMWMISEVIPSNTKALVAIEKQSEDVEIELGRTRRAISKLSSLIQEEEDMEQAAP